MNRHVCDKCGEEVFCDELAEHLMKCEGFSADEAEVLAEIICDHTREEWEA